MAKRSRTEIGPLQVEYICPKCGKHLAWALPTTEICCPNCGTWVTNKNRKHDAEVFYPVNSDQGVLFPQ